MNDALDTAVMLPGLSEKLSKQYRTSPYTVRHYMDLPYAQRRAVDAACDEQAGLSYSTCEHPATETTYTVGRRTTAEPTLPPGTETSYQSSSPQLANPTPFMYLADLAPLALLAQATPEVAETTRQDTEPTFRPIALSPVPAAEAMVACAYPHSLPDFGKLAEATAEVVAPASPHAAPVALDSTVYMTTNYDLFHLLPQNRIVNQSHVRLLVTQISERNLLHTQPLDVTAELGIIDGQHRLAAARELGVPVYYKIGAELSEADITALNVARKNWAGTDYLHFWTVKGRPDYIALTAFMKRHPMLSFSNAKMMLGETQKGSIEDFRIGRWKAGQAYKAEQVAEFIERIAAEVPSFKQPTHTGFVAAVHHCVTSVEGFSSKEFMHKILLNPRMLVPCASLKQFLQMFEEVYNFRTSNEKKVRFL